MTRTLKILSCLLCLLALAACAETELASHAVKKVYGPGSTQQGKLKIGKPYRAEGKWYTPQETYSYTETGIASWYGPGFHGKRTASGERFDTHELTAAHRTLQMPSLLRVTNLENGKSVVVRVNDRGPFARGRIIDVSQRAAELLQFKGRGTAKVRLDLLTEESQALANMARNGQDTRGFEVAVNDGSYQPATLTTPPEQAGSFQNASYQPVTAEPLPPGHIADGRYLPDPVVEQYPVFPTNIYIQAGAFSNKDNAERLAAEMAGLGHVGVYPVMVHGHPFFRVRIGPVATVAEADSLLLRVVSTGRKESIIVVE